MEINVKNDDEPADLEDRGGKCSLFFLLMNRGTQRHSLIWGKYTIGETIISPAALNRTMDGRFTDSLNRQTSGILILCSI